MSQYLSMNLFELLNIHYLVLILDVIMSFLYGVNHTGPSKIDIVGTGSYGAELARFLEYIDVYEAKRLNRMERYLEDKEAVEL